MRRVFTSIFSLYTGLIIAFFFSITPASAQENKGDSEQFVDSTVLVPFPATEITREYDASTELISESTRLQMSKQEIERLKNGVDSVRKDVNAFLADSILLYLDGANIRELDNARVRVNNQISLVAEVQDVIDRRTKNIEEAMFELTHNSLIWQLTREQADEKGVPQVLQLRMDEILLHIDSANMILEKDFNTLLEGQDALASGSKVLKALNDSISIRKEAITKSIFSKDMPPFFEDLTHLEDKALFRNHAEQMNKAFQSDLSILRKKYKGQVWTLLFLFLGSLVYAFWLKRNYAHLIPTEQFKLTRLHLIILESPVASVLFILALMVRFFFVELHESINAISLFIFMVPLMILVYRGYSEKASPWIEWLIVFYIATYFYEILYYPDILQRIFLLGLSVTGAFYFTLVLIKSNAILNMEKGFLSGMLRLFFGLFAALCVAAIFGNLYGAFRMAEYFTLTFMQITMLFLAVLAATNVMSAVIFILLASRVLQKLNVVREDFQVIHKKITRLIILILWIIFIFGTLEFLGLKEPFLTWGSDLLNEGWKVGAVDITPASILVFVFVIWLSIMISRIISRILEKDVFPRVTISRGMPNTLIMLLKISLISGGFFLAAAAAGMELNNLSLVLGAFSVGIGFGLQNVINNMVSGLILAFERPIKVGDTVQVDDLTGIVQTIGFRSSIVRSFDGADVIVPNGNLISNRMINWTRNDFIRRMDIRVGVAYGTDPEKVLEVLRSVGEAHELVRVHPRPQAYFIGFGDSSLDFRLLAWVDIDHRLGVESDLHVSVSKKLEEAGFEIPFPQRDLHLRTDQTKGMEESDGQESQP